MATLVAQALRGVRNLFRAPEPLPPITLSSISPHAQEDFRRLCRRICAEIGKTYTDEFAEAFYNLYPSFSAIVPAAVYDKKGLEWAIDEALKDEAVKKAIGESLIAGMDVPGIMKVVWDRVAPDCW